MRNVATLVQRELGAYFLSPIAYALLVIFLVLTGWAFSGGTFHQGADASLRGLLELSPLILLCLIPFLTMRLISEEFRSGTIETLMTVPVSDVDVVLGKFLGAVAFFIVLLLGTVPYPIILSMYGPVDPKLLLCHYVGLFLLGSLFISVGLFFSAWTKHQLIAGMLSVVVLAVMTYLTQAIAGHVEGWPKAVLQQLSVFSHFGDFVRGLIDFNHVVFFVTMTALFLFLSVKVLEVRRWR